MRGGRIWIPVVIAIGAAGLLADLVWVLAVPLSYGAAGSVGWALGAVLPMYVLGVWLVRRRLDHPQARLLLVGSSALAVGVGMEGPLRQAFLDPYPPGWLLWGTVLYQYAGVVGGVCLMVMLASYPDGVVERRWQRWVLRGLWLHLLLPPLLLLTNRELVLDPWLLDREVHVPSPVAQAWLAPLGPPLATFANSYYGGVAALAVLVVRYLQAARELRHRMRLLVYSGGAAMVVAVVYFTLRALDVPPDSVLMSLVGALFFPISLLIPLCIVVGVLRHRIFDIDVAVRRSMIYGALTLAIAVAYAGLAAAPGLALGNQVPIWLAVALTLVAAVAFQPLRRRLEALADRWVFGPRVNRYRLLTEFGASLEQTVELPQLLPRLAGAVRDGLVASWVRVSLPGAEAVAGTPAGEPALTVPLERGGAVVGHIACGPKDGGYDADDRELLATLARQASTAIANVRLTAELAERLDELGRSRARIVAAEDAERRRIERDLHDGVQQHVVVLIAKLRLARNQVGRGERTADEVLAELQADGRNLLADLRELAHGIHPPVLTDRGLVAAVEARADRLPVPVDVHAVDGVRDRRFGPDVEGAAYYVVCEALTNVVKHARASTADVELSAVDGHLAVVVRDDGAGSRANGDPGHGLTNLRDRVEALGGSLEVVSRPGSGTSVRAELPVGAGHG